MIAYEPALLRAVPVSVGTPTGGRFLRCPSDVGLPGKREGGTATPSRSTRFPHGLAFSRGRCRQPKARQWPLFSYPCGTPPSPARRHQASHPPKQRFSLAESRSLTHPPNNRTPESGFSRHSEDDPKVPVRTHRCTQRRPSQKDLQKHAQIAIASKPRCRYRMSVYRRHLGVDALCLASDAVRRRRNLTSSSVSNA